MVLLIEGVECVGKTTLAEMLARDLGADILHFGVPPDRDVFKFFCDGIVNAQRRNSRLIVDRCHLSNRAYEGMFGGGFLGDGEWRAIDCLCSYLILLTDNPFAIEERQRATLGPHPAREQIGAIQARFYELFAQSDIPHKASHRLTQFVENGERTPLYEALVEFLKALR